MPEPDLHKTNRSQRRLFGAALAISCAAVIALGGTSQAAAVVTSTVNFNTGSGIYTYSYSVLNDGPTFDLAIIDVPVLQSSNLMNLIAPSGFGISFDPGVGLVSFDMLHPTASPTTAIAQQIIHVRNMTLSLNSCDVGSE